MHAFLYFSTLFAVLAGRVLALDLDVGGRIGTVKASDILKVADPALSACKAQCSPASTAIANCSDDICFCNTVTVTKLVACQQCMFEQVIARNDHNPDPKAGSTPLLSAYAAACSSVNVNISTASIMLTLPEKWDGPVALHLSLGVTILAVGTGAFLGSSALILLSNM